MKYSEFERQVEELGFDFTGEDGIYVYVEKEENPLVSINKERTYALTSNYHNFNNIEEKTKEQLFDLASELARTPLADREDEKRYRLVVPFAKGYTRYLNKGKSGDLSIATYQESISYQTIFTKSEAKQLKREHNLNSFVLEEVLEDE